MGHWRSWLARFHGMEEVKGSNPLCSTKIKMKNLKTISELAPNLPRYSYSIHNRQMEPVSLILVGRIADVIKQLEAAGWYISDKISIKSSAKSLWVSIADKSYRSGPMWPSFINGKQNSLGFEMPTKADTYRRRHHLRLWKTNYRLKKNSVWIGTISYDNGIGFIKHSFIPAHHISPNLQLEETYLAQTLNIFRPLYVKVSKPEMGHINTGDAYVWDGKALVLDLSK
jgi:hypothetical protein